MFFSYSYVQYNIGYSSHLTWRSSANLVFRYHAKSSSPSGAPMPLGLESRHDQFTKMTF